MIWCDTHVHISEMPERKIVVLPAVAKREKRLLVFSSFVMVVGTLCASGLGLFRCASVGSAHGIPALRPQLMMPLLYTSLCDLAAVLTPDSIISVNNLHTHDSVKPYVRSKGRKFEKARGRRRSNGFKV